MYKHFLAGAALLLSTATAGLAIATAAGESGFLTGPRLARSSASEMAGQGNRLLLASESRERGRHADRLAKRDRRYHDDDDDDDEEDGERGSRAMIPQNGPANPNAPVPGNGLFNGTSRPTVQVQ